MNIINPSTSMKSNPTNDSPTETECLFGELVKVLDEYQEWVFCKLFTDGYCGWVKKNSLGYFKKATHRVLSIRTCVFSCKDIKSSYLNYLSIGSLLNIKNIDSNWAEVCLSSQDNFKSAYVPTKHIVDIKHKVKDWVSVAEQFIGTPYKWGGRNSIGIDCSALLQLSYQAFGENIPRNTKDQIKVTKKRITELRDLKRGHVIFWKGHVGIMVDNLNCLHSNAFHMKTVIEPLKDVILRFGKDSEIISVLDFND